MFDRPFIVRLAFEGFSLRASVLLDVAGNLRADLLVGQICYALCLFCSSLLAGLRACLYVRSFARPSLRSFVCLFVSFFLAKVGMFAVC